MLRFLRLLMRFLFKSLLTLVVALTLAYFAVGAYVDRQLAKKDYSQAYDDCRKIWTARGLYGNGVPQNSIESIAAAFDAGAMGVEVDIRYDKKTGDYIVSHDYPYNLKNGKLLTLEELFDNLGERYPGRFYWLDYKGIRHLGEYQAGAIQRLIDISRDNGVMPYIYVEGEAPIALAAFRDAGFKSLYDTHPAPESQSFLAAFMIGVYRMVYYFGDFTVMGMEYGDLEDPVYGPETRKRLGPVPVFLYHVPVDEKLVRELLPLPAVRAMIVGNNQSVNLHHLDACSTD